MNGTRTILAVVVSLVLVLSALPAEAVSFIGQFCASKFNTAGTASTEMTPRNTTFCYISRVNFEETDTGSEEAECRVTRGTNSWFVQATLGRSADADAVCCAICFNN